MTIKIGFQYEGTVIIPTMKKGKGFEFVGNSLKQVCHKTLNEAISFFNYSSKKDEMLFFRKLNMKILSISIPENYSVEDLRKIYAKANTYLKSLGEKKVFVTFPKESEEIIKGVVEGLSLSNYKFDKYLSKSVDSLDEDFEIDFNLDCDLKYKELIEETLKVCENVKYVRDLVNENASVVSPEYLAKEVSEFSKKFGLKTNILGEKELEKLGMNLILAVGKGSSRKPRLICVEYLGDKNNLEKIALVGKGITFDTGGLNLKPTGFIEDMKCDMGGAATAFGTFKSCVELGVKKNIVLVMSCAENSIGKDSYIPGDVIKSYSGKTVEIKNTDAEGRLVLADAISYVQDKYKVSKIIDMATLTGACLIALGPTLIASLGNEPKMLDGIFKSGEEEFEQCWNLPIYDEHRDLLESKIADFTNLGGRFGGTSSAGAFLEKFVCKNVKWVHLDLAGAAYSKKSKEYIPEFGTGRGVRLLVNFLKNN